MKLHMQTNSFAAAANDARGAAQGYQARPQQGAPPPPAPAAAAEHPPVVKVNKPCNYGIKCKKSYCKFQHPEVRDLSHNDFPLKPPVGLAFFSPCARRERILSVCNRVHFLLCTSLHIFRVSDPTSLLRTLRDGHPVARRRRRMRQVRPTLGVSRRLSTCAEVVLRWATVSSTLPTTHSTATHAGTSLRWRRMAVSVRFRAPLIIQCFGIESRIPLQSCRRNRP